MRRYIYTGAREVRLSVRVSEKDIERLNAIAQNFGVSKGKAISEALRIVYQDLKKYEKGS